MYDRSCMPIDPRIPTLPGRTTFGFHRPGRRCLHQGRSAVRCPTSQTKGEMHPSISREADMYMDGISNESASISQRFVWSGHSNYLVGALPHAPRDATIPLVRRKGFATPRKMISLSIITRNRQTKATTRYPGTLRNACYTVSLPTDANSTKRVFKRRDNREEGGTGRIQAATTGLITRG